MLNSRTTASVIGTRRLHVSEPNSRRSPARIRKWNNSGSFRLSRFLLSRPSLADFDFWFCDFCVRSIWLLENEKEISQPKRFISSEKPSPLTLLTQTKKASRPHTGTSDANRLGLHCAAHS